MKSKLSQNPVMGSPWKLLPLARWLGPIDVVLIVVAVLTFVTDYPYVFLDIIFALLTLGAFVWPLRSFALRAGFWVTVTAAREFMVVLTGPVQVEELIEIPLLSTIIIMAALISRRRAKTEAELAALLAAEQEHSKRLDELAALKADFTAIVAHELASPLMAIRGFASMLASGTLSRADRDRAIAAIESEARMLTTLVADVQNAARLEQDDFAFHMQVVPLGTLLADAVDFAKTLPGEHPLTTTIAADTSVRADPGRIRQVLRNLLSNAAKYSLPGTMIEVRTMLDAERVWIVVADRGIGIHPDDVDRIFAKFSRGRNLAGHRVDGLGVGLYLARQLVQAHGGDLTVTSTLGVGSEFVFSLERG